MSKKKEALQKLNSAFRVYRAACTWPFGMTSLDWYYFEEEIEQAMQQARQLGASDNEMDEAEKVTA